jgi:VanZ family protein
MNPSRDFVKYWLPVILFASFIFLMSTDTFSSEHTFSVVRTIIQFLAPGLSGGEVDLIHAIIRKLAHLVEYLILGFLLFRAFRGPSSAWWSWRWFFLASMGVLLWAASDEFHQSFVATRTASTGDVGIDMVGGLLGQLASALWKLNRGKRDRISTWIPEMEKGKDS